MIKAIVEGRKTQTRRVIKPCSTATVVDKDGRRIQPDWVYTEAKPRYQVGEVVYIKEAWAEGRALSDYVEGLHKIIPIYKADIDPSFWSSYDWLAPLFMPAWAARYFIKITDVRPERLQEIDIRDIHAEGVRLPEDKVGYYGKLYVDAFHNLWNSINKPPHDWNGNPYVFVYSFERMEDK